MALARGGQTLLSAAAREDLGKSEHKLVSHGHWQIKGVSDPIELFEVGEPDARFVQPSDGEKAHRVVWMGDWWLPVNEIPNNLPLPGDVVHRPRARAGGGQAPARRHRAC